MAAFMIRNLPSVHPYGGLVIHCAKMQDHLLAGPLCGNRKAAFVPDQIMEAGFPDAA
ncbi:hypothetical protein D3C75_1266050 [compost metagenome]